MQLCLIQNLEVVVQTFAIVSVTQGVRFGLTTSWMKPSCCMRFWSQASQIWRTWFKQEDVWVQRVNDATDRCFSLIDYCQQLPNLPQIAIFQRCGVFRYHSITWPSPVSAIEGFPQYLPVTPSMFPNPSRIGILAPSTERGSQ